MPSDDLRGKNILVLGAYGFIGAAVARALTAEGASVRGLVRNLPMGNKVLPGTQLIQGDLRNLNRS